jgi:hypothetical protein
VRPPRSFPRLTGWLLQSRVPTDSAGPRQASGRPVCAVWGRAAGPGSGKRARTSAALPSAGGAATSHRATKRSVPSLIARLVQVTVGRPRGRRPHVPIPGGALVTLTLVANLAYVLVGLTLALRAHRPCLGPIGFGRGGPVSASLVPFGADVAGTVTRGGLSNSIGGALCRGVNRGDGRGLF